MPCSFQLGRKDRLWRNIVQMQLKHGKEHFNFMPQTYCLPGDLDELKKAWDEEGENQRWIMKPVRLGLDCFFPLFYKFYEVKKLT